MPLFDSYVIVDWSAAAHPAPERESPNAIWWAAARRHAEAVEPRYVRTRAEAVVQLSEFIGKELGENRRILAGFDFPFGYPAGVAGTVTGRDSAICLWRWIADPDRSKDGPRNANNRFEVAERWLNESVERSCGWPQHITSYIKGLALALLPDDDAESLRALTSDACRDAIAQGESGRQEYYGARLAPFRDIAPALKAVVAAIREARSKGCPGVDWAAIRKAIRESAEDMQSQGMVWTIDLAAVPDMLVRHGILQQAPEADGCWTVPIPSLADRILAQRF